MPDLSHICDLHLSSWQHWILNPLSKARDQTCILTETSLLLNPRATTGTPSSRGCLFFTPSLFSTYCKTERLGSFNTCIQTPAVASDQCSSKRNLPSNQEYERQTRQVRTWSRNFQPCHPFAASLGHIILRTPVCTSVKWGHSIFSTAFLTLPFGPMARGTWLWPQDRIASISGMCI